MKHILHGMLVTVLVLVATVLMIALEHLQAIDLRGGEWMALIGIIFLLVIDAIVAFVFVKGDKNK